MRRGQTLLRAGTRIDANPIHRPSVLPELFGEDFRGRVRGITAPRTQAPIHRFLRSHEPKTEKRDTSRCSNLGEGPPFRRF